MEELLRNWRNEFHDEIKVLLGRGSQAGREQQRKETIRLEDSNTKTIIRLGEGKTRQKPFGAM